MTPKKRRVTKSLFGVIMKNGLLIHSPFFTLRYIKDPSVASYNLAVVAPKSVAKTAVLRNSLRRRGYRALLGVNIPQGVVGAIFYKKQAIDIPFPELLEDLNTLFSKIK